MNLIFLLLYYINIVVSGFQGIEGTIFSAARGLASKLVQSEQQGKKTLL